MVNVYDESIGELRDDYQLDLTDVETEDDLRKAFEKLPDKDGNPVPLSDPSKQNLLNSVKDYFNKSDSLQPNISQKIIDDVDTTDSVDRLNRVNKRIRDLEPRLQDDVIEKTNDKKIQLIIDSINENVQRDISLFDLPPSKLKSPISPSGVTITTASASIVKDKILAGETILPEDINF
tara:strand:+ start:5029 stop:5562 length:534 start_codon:yes stop_codon:yes gene_type:complete